MTTQLKFAGSYYGLVDYIDDRKLSVDLAGAHDHAKTVISAFRDLTSDFTPFRVQNQGDVSLNLRSMLHRLRTLGDDTSDELRDALANVIWHDNGLLSWDYSGGVWTRPIGVYVGAWCPFRVQGEADADVWSYWVGFNVAPV